MIISSFPGLPQVGAEARRGAPAARPRSVAQPAVLPQLRADLVRLDAAGGRPQQDPLVGALARLCARPGAAVQFARLCADLRLSARLADESHQQVQCVVDIQNVCGPKSDMAPQTMRVMRIHTHTHTYQQQRTSRFFLIKKNHFDWYASRRCRRDISFYSGLQRWSDGPPITYRNISRLLSRGYAIIIHNPQPAPTHTHTHIMLEHTIYTNIYSFYMNIIHLHNEDVRINMAETEKRKIPILDKYYINMHVCENLLNLYEILATQHNTHHTHHTHQITCIANMLLPPTLANSNTNALFVDYEHIAHHRSPTVQVADDYRYLVRHKQSNSVLIKYSYIYKYRTILCNSYAYVQLCYMHKTHHTQMIYI